MNGGHDEQQLESYEQRRAREGAEREQQHAEQMQRQAARLRAVRLDNVDKKLERFEPWVEVLTAVRAELVEQHAELDIEATDYNERSAARRRAGELLDAIDTIDRGPRDFGRGMLDVPTEVEDALLARGIPEPPRESVSRSRFAGRPGLRKSSRRLEELRRERAKLVG